MARWSRPKPPGRDAAGVCFTLPRSPDRRSRTGSRSRSMRQSDHSPLRRAGAGRESRDEERDGEPRSSGTDGVHGENTSWRVAGDSGPSTILPRSCSAGQVDWSRLRSAPSALADETPEPRLVEHDDPVPLFAQPLDLHRLQARVLAGGLLCVGAPATELIEENGPGPIPAS